MLTSILLVACAPSPSTAPGPLGDEPILDLSYGDSEIHQLDLYRSSSDEPQDLVVFVHGGSWVSGDKENLADAPGLITWFQDRGYAVAAPNFRLPSPISMPRNGHTIPDQATDIASAIGWLDAHRGTYGLSDAGPVLVGFSSGAHMVALVSSDPRYLEAEGLSPSDLHASISLDVHAYDVPLALELMEGSEIDDNRDFIIHLFGETEEEQLALSPASWVANAVPRTLLVSAEPSSEPNLKGYIARETSALHRDRLEAAGHEATHAHFDGLSHNGLVMGFGSPGHGSTESIEAFLASP